MKGLSIASQLAINLSVMETQFLKSPYIENEHIFLGLCKCEDILRLDSIEGLKKNDFIEAKKEISEFVKFLERLNIEPKKTRRRLRAIIKQRQQEGEFTGHRSASCKKMFSLAEELSNKEQTPSIELIHFFYAILKFSSPILEELFAEIGATIEDIVKPVGIEPGEAETLFEEDTTLLNKGKDKK